MSGLLSILSGSVGGLEAATGAAATASNNLENVDTAGYATETVTIEESSSSFANGQFIGGGSYLGNVTEARSSFIESQLPALMGQASYSSAQSTALQGMSAFNDGANGNPLAEALSNFFSGLQTMSSDPTDSSAREAVVGDATSLAEAFNSASSAISSAQTGLDDQISGNISQINQLSSQMASLNQQIQVAEAAGQSPNSLIDQRTTAEDTLAQLTGATPVPNSAGQISMMLPGGQALVSGSQAATLSTVADPNNGGHLAVQITEPGTTTATTLADSALGGSIGGSLNTRDGALAQAASGLDNLAYGLGTAINSVQSAGFGTDGSTGNNFFDVGTSATGAASRITVDSAIANNPAAIAAAATAGDPGDGTNLQSMIDVGTQAMAGGSSPADALASIVSTYGAASQTAQAESQNDAALQSNMQSQQQSVSGVSSNEATVQLTQSQQAFQAMSQIIQTTDSMLQSILSIQTQPAE